MSSHGNWLHNAIIYTLGGHVIQMYITGDDVKRLARARTRPGVIIALDEYSIDGKKVIKRHNILATAIVDVADLL